MRGSCSSAQPFRINPARIEDFYTWVSAMIPGALVPASPFAKASRRSQSFTGVSCIVLLWMLLLVGESASSPPGEIRYALLSAFVRSSARY
eukprot:3632126-Rhodomonas_salina.1